MTEIYPDAYPTLERTLHPATTLIVDALKGANYQFEWSKADLMRLDSKVHNYLGYLSRHNQSQALGFDIQTMTDSLIELSPNGLRKWLTNSSQNLGRRIQLHNENAARTAQKLKDKKLEGPKTPFTVETELDGGKYYLAKLSTKEHFENESAWLKHCLGTSHIEAYLASSNKGTAEYFTIRERWQLAPYDRRTEILLEILLEKPASIHQILPDAPRLKGLNTEVVDYITHPDNESIIMGLQNMPDIAVVTLEYWPASKAIAQIKTYKDGRANRRVSQTDPFVRAVTETIKYFKSGTGFDSNGKEIKRGVETMSDTEELVEKGKILLADGRVVPPELALDANPDDVLNGTLQVLPHVPAEGIAKLCQKLPIEYDFTKATSAQRDAVTHVAGRLWDNGHGDVRYANLESVARSFDIRANTGAVELPSLKRVDGIFKVLANGRVTCPNLESVGSTIYIHCKEELMLGKLRKVGEDAEFSTHTVNLPVLEEIGGVLDAQDVRELLIPELKLCKKIRFNNQGGRILIGNDEIRKKLSTR